MMSRTLRVVGILMLIIGACIPSPSSFSEPTVAVPPTLTALPTSTPSPVALPTDTPTPTVELQSSETQPPVSTLTFSASIATVPPTQRASRTRIPVDTPTATTELQPSETPSPTLTPTLSCERETASVILSASAGSLKVGDAVKVTVTVNNEGCLTLGLPQYRLYIQSDTPQTIFTPENPEPVEHSLGVAPEQSDSTQFDLTAVATGQATLTATVSYEVHLGYPGPAYWGMTGTGEPLILTVAP